MGLRSGDWLGHSSRLTLWSPNHTLMTLAVFGVIVLLEDEALAQTKLLH